MTRRSVCAVVMGLLTATGCAHEVHARSTGEVAQLANDVGDTERRFAKAMADRDPAAFRALLSAEATFVGRKTLHGPDEIMAVWAKFFEGPRAPFSWAPERVEVLPSGTLAFTTGPVKDPEGQVVADFSSIWRLEAGGWRIVFDHGCDRCRCPAEP